MYIKQLIKLLKFHKKRYHHHSLGVNYINLSWIFRIIFTGLAFEGSEIDVNDNAIRMVKCKGRVTVLEEELKSKIIVTLNVGFW